MAANPFVIIVPCHRVVARNGLGGFAWGRETKEKMQKLEKDVSQLQKRNFEGWMTA
jgi:O6-methylguanine-DNA--protein-cysteine methyltransferase